MSKYFFLFRALYSLPFEGMDQWLYIKNQLRKLDGYDQATFDPILNHKKHRYFYGCVVPVTLHRFLVQVHKIDYPSIQETASLQALITGIYDDLIDQEHLSVAQVQNLLYGSHPKNLTSQERLCRFLFHKIEHRIKNKIFFESITHQLIRAQEESKKQSIKNLTSEELWKITLDKGGLALLFYRTSLPLPCRIHEYEFLYQLGGLMQLTNDINDVFKDSAQGIQTIMTSGLTFIEVKKAFWAQINAVFRAWQEFQPRKHLDHFDRISLILSRSLLTLEQYEKYTPTTEELSKIPKRQRITGLSLPYSWWRWFQLWKEIQSALSVSPTA